MNQILHRNGLDFKDFEKILDFGCGCGRVVRHMQDLVMQQIYGTDINSQLVRWCSRNLGYGRFQQNDFWPSLPFPDRMFDFVFAFSVFTHLPEQLQLPWMREISRVLKDGGYLLITTHSDRDIQGRLTDEQYERFRSGELIVHGEYSLGSNACSAYHPAAFIRNEFTRGYAIVDFVQEGAKGNPFQDLLLLRKE